ncbi:hypothetical protein MPL1_06074 [Methylophaga lonarensis MPL]|uniref:Leucine-binding protein domain-containing protein n=1 Tax=Methylophaga lonarensis MPL TaxID=1286106 RepID=M7PS44_9GAMM|nr:hypothetical protein [Methylophaga lonarensis]EMR13239.1 hypothetical protein MPL1_06074 [Methylophaga lonarensis MPL]
MKLKKLLASAFCGALLIPAATMADVLEVTLHYAGPESGSAWKGVQQGVDEANLQGQFLGQNYQIQVVNPDDIDSIEDITVLLMATDEETMLNIAQHERLSNVAVFNLTSGSDALREACQPNLLSTIVSDSMKQDALAQWQERNPDTPVSAQAWHEDFEKFAARQLNNRFSRAHGVPMDDEAWAGWAASKMVTDSIARTQNLDSSDMLTYLKTEIAFDGQKGDGMTFRENGQLRQIILLIDEANEIVAEAPLRGVSGGLDSLGQNNSCQ